MTVQHGLRWTERFARRTHGEGRDAIAAIMALATESDIISFSGGFPDPATFPAAEVSAALADLVHAGDVTAFQYTPTAGLPSTRDYLAGRLEAGEGRRPPVEDLMITSGSIEALELVAKTFLDPGDCAVVEAPTYLGAIMAFRGFEARVEPVPMDTEGLRVDVLQQRLADGLRPKLLYTIPDHHNPAGVSLTEERRAALVELARHYGFLVIEDVAYRELSFDGTRRTSLWTLAPDVVVQAGTFSKTFFPGVRLGWVVAPAEVTAELVVAKQNTDQCAAGLGQRLLEVHGRTGLLDAQIARARELYRRRATLLMAALEESMPEGVSWTRPSGGFFSWVTLPTHLDSVALARAALEQKVAYVPGPPFFADGRGHDSLRLSFSRISDDEIAEGVRRLAALFR